MALAPCASTLMAGAATRGGFSAGASASTGWSPEASPLRCCARARRTALGRCKRRAKMDRAPRHNTTAGMKDTPCRMTPRLVAERILPFELRTARRGHQDLPERRSIFEQGVSEAPLVELCCSIGDCRNPSHRTPTFDRGMFDPGDRTSFFDRSASVLLRSNIGLRFGRF